MLLTSTNRFGVPDLDTRPPEMMRSTMHLWIQRCPSCGYCAPDVSKAIPNAEVMVKSPAYVAQLASADYPELANSFLCLSILEESMSEYASAGWACIRAAWACDDADNQYGAVQCRLRAAGLLDRARDHDQRFAGQEGAEEALLADLFRRAGQFDRAIQLCDEGLQKEKSLEPVILDILDFQKSLIRKADTTCHQVREA